MIRQVTLCRGIAASLSQRIAGISSSNSMRVLPKQLQVPVCRSWLVAATSASREENVDLLFCLQQQQQRGLSSTSAGRVVVPPNLRFDPRSSYAPTRTRRSSKDDNRPVAEKSSVQVKDDDEIKVQDDGTTIQATETAHGADSVKYDDDDDDDDDLFLPQDEVTYAIPLPERLHVNIHTLFAPQHSSQVGTIHLEENVFGRDPIRVDLLKRAVDYYRAKKRGRRKAVTKTIGQLSYSKRKIRPQKGTGRARMGHAKAPHLRGGAKAHGPKNVTDYGKTKLNKKVRRLAMCHALSQKLLEGNLIVLNQLYDLPTHKTKELVRLLEPWEIGGKYGTTALILDHYYNLDEANTQGRQLSYAGVPVNLWIASSNLHQIKVGNDHAGNVHDILKFDKLVLTLSALEQLESRLEYLD